MYTFGQASFTKFYKRTALAPRSYNNYQNAFIHCLILGGYAPVVYSLDGANQFATQMGLSSGHHTIGLIQYPSDAGTFLLQWGNGLVLANGTSSEFLAEMDECKSSLGVADFFDPAKNFAFYDGES